MPRVKKLRADSKFALLSDEQRDELARLMLAGGKLTEHQEWLAGHGVKVSLQSISEYYQRHVLPTKWQRMNETAALLANVDGESVADAAHRAIAQRVLEMSLDPEADTKELATYYKLMIDGEATVQSERKLAMLEAREARAEEACAVAGDKALSAEERTRKIREIFGMS